MQSDCLDRLAGAAQRAPMAGPLRLFKAKPIQEFQLEQSWKVSWLLQERHGKLFLVCHPLYEVRRPSWSDVIAPPPPESDDEACHFTDIWGVQRVPVAFLTYGPAWGEAFPANGTAVELAMLEVIEFTKEDLFKEDAPKKEVTPEVGGTGNVRVR